MKEALKWVAGVLFSLVAFAAVTQKGFISFIFFAMASSICIPPLLELIQKKLQARLPSWSKYVLIIGCWFLGAVFSPGFKKASEPKQDVTKPETIFARDTVYVHDTVRSNFIPITAPQKERASKKNVTKKTPSDDEFLQSLPDGYVGTGEEFRKPVKKSKRRSSSKSGYITGPRGGCYYINGNGKKVYVDHSYCQ